MKYFITILLTVLMLNAVEVPKFQKNHAFALGSEAAKELKKTLKGALGATIKKEGLVKGVQFCANSAANLTAKVQKGLPKGVLIKRISDKVRNPANAMDELDKTALGYFETVKKQDGEYPKHYMSKLRSKYDREMNIFRYYEPLLVGDACIKCHGTNLDPYVKNEIKKHYPNDKAIGYKKGDLRGLIVVQVLPQAIYNRANQK
jgi:hypothetical protein